MKYKLSIKVISQLVVILCICYNSVAQSPQYSKLWGKDGESWNKERIPDFTTAGYKSGKLPIPDFPVKVNVKKFGAKGDGITDNTMAFRKAIAGCPTNGTIYIPEGIYLLTDTLIIAKGGICFRGAGINKTTLFFKKGLEELYPDYGKYHKAQSRWSWSGAMILFKGNISDNGIENLTIRFPDNKYDGHNFHERSYNAIGFSDSACNGWIRNLTFINSDIAIWIETTAHHITAEKWVLDFGPVRVAQDISGHHAVNIYGGYNLLQYFEIKGKYVHDLSVESANSKYNVFQSGKGKDLAIDHHNHNQSNNLFTDLDAGIGSRLYRSGGNAVPRGICTNEMFWNIRSQNTVMYCNQYDDSTMHSKNNVCVGLNTSLPSIFGDAHNNWFETVQPLQLFPQNLYKAQLKYKGL